MTPSNVESVETETPPPAASNEIAKLKPGHGRLPHSAYINITEHHYYRFRNSLDDVVELMKMRGIHLSHQTVHNWSQTFGVQLGLKLREKRYVNGILMQPL